MFSFSVLLAFLIAFVSLASRLQARADRWNQTYQTLAKRYGGVFSPTGWIGRPSVRFVYGSTGVIVNTITSRQHGAYTRIELQWPDPHLRLQIFARAGMVLHKPLRGLTEIPLGDVDFDGELCVLGSNEEEVRAFLTEGVKKQIKRLQSLLDIRSVYLRIQRGRMVVKKPSHIQSYEELEEFTHLVTQLYDQAMLSRAVGIEFVAGEHTNPTSEAICQICGDCITADVVFCRRCQTPHHHDCWQYYGSCAVYGCGEGKFVTQKLAQPPPGA